jgi:hypothetical protein
VRYRYQARTAEAEGNEELADALDAIQPEILPEVVDEVRASLPH